MSLSQSERVLRGARAEQDLSVTGPAIAKLRQHLLEAIAATTFNDQAGRERLYLSVSMLPEIERMLVEIISDGKLAESEIALAQRLKASE